jgi:subtilisin-like proprotein convertase family protein
MRLVIVIFLIVASATGHAQQTVSIWSDKQESRMNQAAGRNIIPDSYRTLQADINALQNALVNAPDERVISPDKSSTLLRIPRPEGGFDIFRIAEYAMMEAGLQARFPEIRTYRGINIANPFITIRLQWTTHGFGAMISGDESGKYFVVPYARRNQTDYISYYKNDYRAVGDPFECYFINEKKELPRSGIQNRLAGDCTFRSYRLAIATTGEYANFHDAYSSADVDTLLSAVVIAINRINEVYERDVAVRLILIETTTNVFYYDGTTDPYSNGNGSAMLNENQTTMNAQVGSANYDIGHVFSTGGGGVAVLNGPCVNSKKAKGVTGQSSPIDDPFYIDYVAHEMGHQFGANHTQNNSCGRNSATAMEPGSASTIMGYAGICAPNVQSNSDDYFHGISMQEIRNYISAGNGDNCDIPITWTNNPPVVTPGSDYAIPVSTPFMLNAIVSDPDGDPIRFLWEQWDNEVGSVMPPDPTNTQGPMFRTFDPDSIPTRVFPKIQDIINNNTPTWEVLPSISRDMEFRMSATDFHNAMAGCSDEDNIIISTDAGAGPFLVLGPNSAMDTWTEGNLVDVTWDVANTDASSVNCSAVDIFLSRDGGYTYPDTLAIGASNTGMATIEVPTGITTQGRVMVKGSDNVFFDISDEDFEILTGVADYLLNASPTQVQLCEVDPTTEVQIEIAVVPVNSYSDPVTLLIDTLPGGAAGSLSSIVVTPGDTAILTLFNLSSLAIGSHDIILIGTSVAGDKQVSIRLDIIDTNAVVVLLTPANDTTGVELIPEVRWLKDEAALSYTIEVGTDSLFTNIISTATTTDTAFVVNTTLTGSTQYFWRVRSMSSCHASPWSIVYNFTTVDIFCFEIASSDVPKAISSSGTPTVLSGLMVIDDGFILDLNVLNLNISHTWVGDLDIRLTSPQGTEVVLMGNICGNSDNVDINFDDDASSTSPCPPNDGGIYQPQGLLANFNGESIKGDWILTVNDDANLDGGTLNSWSINVCISNYACNKTVLNTNADGPGSLKQVLECAQSGDTVTFHPDLADSTFNIDSTIVISQSITVLGPDSGQLSIDGSQLARTFEILTNVEVEFRNFKIGSGTNVIGGAILNQGSLILRDIVIFDTNNVQFQTAIENQGPLVLIGDCVIQK